MNLQELEDNGLLNNEMIKWDGFDDCILGVGSRCGMQDILVYSRQKIAYKLRDRDEMTLEEAIEYIDFNIVGAFVGEGTPMILEDFI
tara:strand:- start:2228 stop:2488 length:261 start_codon:yes stop_codon:yes gene_type:complete